MEENPRKTGAKDRPHYINYGIGVLMVVLAAIIGHFNGGFWWWVIGSAVIGFALVLHGHFPQLFTKKRIGAVLAVAVLIGLVAGIGWWFGARSKPNVTAGATQAPAADGHQSTAGASVDPKPSKQIKVADETETTNAPARKRPRRGEVTATPAASPPAVSSQTGPAVGSITQGPCSITQVGGVQNQAIGGDCGPPSYPIPSDKKQAELSTALAGAKGFVAVITRSNGGPTRDFANLLAGIFHNAQWSVAYPGMLITGTSIGPDGLPEKIPTGIHIEANTQTDVLALFVRKKLKDVVGIDSVIDQKDNITEGGIAIFIGEPDQK